MFDFFGKKDHLFDAGAAREITGKASQKLDVALFEDCISASLDRIKSSSERGLRSCEVPLGEVGRSSGRHKTKISLMSDVEKEAVIGPQSIRRLESLGFSAAIVGFGYSRVIVISW